jgi:diaminopimelate epimerase
MLWIGPADDAMSSASYRVFNADGSEVQQCGNGVRCVAKYLTQDERQPRRFWLQSPAGNVAARVLTDGQVAVSMGAPVFVPADIPFEASEVAVRYTLALAEQSLDVSVLSMGNPHCVLLVDDASTAAVAKIGAQIENHARFPERANVGFMQVRDRQHIVLRVHERGVGETQGCGTGACAAVVAGIVLDLLDTEVRVRLPGGEVMVNWHGGDDPVWLTGNAETISAGMMDL